MLRLAPLAFVCLAALVPSARAEDLFSELAVESVFSGQKKSDSSTAKPTEASAPRITGSGQLGKLVREAGYDPERLDGKSVRITVSHGRWTVPTTLRADVDRSQIAITMGLATPAKPRTTSQLLDLLETAPDAGGAHFAWDRDSGQVQLIQTNSARGLTVIRLKRLLVEMAELAASREDAWFEGGVEPSSPAPAAPAPSLTGAWVASLGAGEAFALSLTADNKFALAHVKNGKTTLSKGTVQRVGDRLKLVGEKGVTIDGQVSGVTGAAFDFTLPSGKKLSFKKQQTK